MMTGTPVPAATLVLVLLVLVLLLAVDAREPFACDPKDQRTRSFPFCRASLPIPERVRDLVGRLTLQEKVKLLTNNADAVPRLGIGGYEWWSEGLHGVSNVGPGTMFGGDFPGATSFPQVITTAASFNVSLWEAIGQVVSDEARAMYNGGMGGLTYWTPNINILQDPRWGRGQETPGEDPLVVGQYAASHVRGLQGGDGGIRLKVAACCKSFTAYSLDNWNGVNRLTFNARVSKQDMEDTFSVPFEMCVMEGKVASVMCSFNQVNGVPTCADPNLLKKTVRGAWHLDGYIVSECDSVDVFYNSQHYTSTPQQAVAHAIKAGLDLNCGYFLANHTEEAVRGGLLNETEVDGALLNTLTVQMRLGMFDGEPSAQAYGTLGPKDVCTLAHQELALEAARQGIVLLKNLQLALPLSPSRHRTVAVIGPNSNVTKTMIGNYEGTPCGYTTPLQGIGNYTKTIHQEGCADVGCSDNGLFGGAIEAARSSDATILVMGLDQSIERESMDRDSLFLPGQQQELVSKVATASKGPTVLVLMSGGPIDISFANVDPRVAAILWAGYPGQAGGAAIADILFGATNPGGRLPMTWYPEDYLARAPMTVMDMRPTVSYPGRTYRFYEGPVVYPFGYGLSYTSFVHSIVAAPAVVAIPLNGRRPANANMTLSKAVKVAHARCAGLLLVVQLDVRNAGAREGPETVLTYSTPPRDGGAGWVPRKQLVGFHRVHVAAGTSERVRINIHACKYLSVVDRSGIRRIPMGEHRLQIGDAKHSVLLRAETSGGI